MQSVTAPDGTMVRVYNSNDPSVAVPPSLINSYSILTIPAYYRAMRFLSENLASFPRCVHKDAAETGIAHPLDAILKRRPNGYQSATVFWRTLFFGAAHTNNGFARIERAGNRPIALHPLNEGDVLPFRYVPEDGSGPQQYYFVRSSKTILFGDDVLHLTAFSIDGMTGIDPVHLHTDSYQRAKTVDKYTTRFLMKGTVLRGSVEVPGEMSDEQIKEFRQLMRSNFRGAEAEDDVIILPNGAKLNNVTMPSTDAQLIEQASYSTRQISQITGVHPYYLFDDKDGKYNSNAEQAGIDVVRYCFRPWMELVDDELTTKLLSASEQNAGYAVRLNAKALTRGDSKTVTSTTIAQANAGLVTPNEARTVLELPPDPDPKSNTLRIVGDTNPGPADPADEPATPPKQHSRAPGKQFSTVTEGQWEALEADAMELNGESDGETPAPFAINVHQGGAIGTAAALAYFPPGTTIDTQTAAGSHSFSVGAHAPHAHPNWVVPALTQTAGSILPGNPSPVTLAHVAKMAAGSKVMGMDPVVTVRKAAAPPAPAVPAPYSALRPIIDALCDRIESKTVKAFDNAKGKAGELRTIWANVFAETQGKYVTEAFAPVCQSLVAMGATEIDLPRLSDRYSAQIRKRAATGEAVTLRDIAKTHLPVETHAK